MEEILKQIVDKRTITIQKKGINFGINVPEKRVVPLTMPDLKNGIVICEIKRGSPSEGKMNDISDPVSWAGNYIESGAGAISVLTEEDFFFGSLNDLMKIKNKFPSSAVLRKDFLLNEEEIEVSYKSGADMVLLITSILQPVLLEKMKNKAESLGMLPLIEIHDIDELNVILPLKPNLIGINSRNLKTFKIDRTYPFALMQIIREHNAKYNYHTHVIFESGIRNFTDAFFTGSSDFSGVLVGTSIIKSFSATAGNLKEKIMEIKNGFTEGKKTKNDFFTKIFHRIHFLKPPVVKICGITNIDDAQCAIKCGADIIGFIIADSLRKISLDQLKDISGKIGDKVLKVAVVVDENLKEAADLVKDGIIDAVQFSGDQTNDECMKYGVSWYKAVRLKEKADLEKRYFCPFVLFDAFSKTAYGGTGKLIDSDLLDHAKSTGIEMFLAGGINPENVFEMIKTYDPLMIDLSSGVEASPGKKDHNKMKKLFDEIKRSYK